MIMGMRLGLNSVPVCRSEEIVGDVHCTAPHRDQLWVVIRDESWTWSRVHGAGFLACGNQVLRGIRSDPGIAEVTAVDCSTTDCSNFRAIVPVELQLSHRVRPLGQEFLESGLVEDGNPEVLGLGQFRAGLFASDEEVGLLRH